MCLARKITRAKWKCLGLTTHGLAELPVALFLPSRMVGTAVSRNKLYEQS